jgi:hypothetical protein
MTSRKPRRRSCLADPALRPEFAKIERMSFAILYASRIVNPLRAPARHAAALRRLSAGLFTRTAHLA